MAFLNQGGVPIECRRFLLPPGAALAFFLFSYLMIWQANAQPRENEIKAAFLYHFTQFVEWPTNAFDHADSPLIIGVLGPDPFDRALDLLVQGESIRGRSLEVRRYAAPEAARDAHILFISKAEEREWPAILRLLENRPVLSVSEINNFAARGGVIQFYNEENRVRLRINHNNARKAGLSLSSKLLRVAQVIDSN